MRIYFFDERNLQSSWSKYCQWLYWKCWSLWSRIVVSVLRGEIHLCMLDQLEGGHGSGETNDWLISRVDLDTRESRAKVVHNEVYVCCGTRSFVSVWCSLMHLIFSQQICLRTILIVSYQWRKCLPRCIFPSGVPNKILYAFPVSPGKLYKFLACFYASFTLWRDVSWKTPQKSTHFQSSHQAPSFPRTLRYLIFPPPGTTHCAQYFRFVRGSTYLNNLNTKPRWCTREMSKFHAF